MDMLNDKSSDSKPKHNVPFSEIGINSSSNITQQDIETDKRNPKNSNYTDNTTSASKTNTNKLESNGARIPTEGSISKDNQIAVETAEDNFLNLPSLLNVWQPYEEEAKNFWVGKNPNKSMIPPSANSSSVLNSTSSVPPVERTLLELLKDGVVDAKMSADSKTVDNAMGVTPQQPTTFQCHNVGCRNENKSFTSLRQIYPNKEVSSLWDLFVKCNGDIDWAVDILLNEDEMSFGVDVKQYETGAAKETMLRCDCDIKENAIEDSPLLSSTPLLPPQMISTGRTQRQRGRVNRSNQRSNNEVRDTIRETIENCFILGDEHYSKDMRKKRDVRNGHLNTSSAARKTKVNIETQTEFEYEQEEDLNDEILEVALGEQLVQQLSDIFKTDTTLLGDHLPPQSNVNVFMPRSLAKEVYMLWLESAYNQIEEQRQQTLHEDESFARLLKIPKYEHFKQSPSNARELLDMEMALMLYNSEREHKPEQEFAQNTRPTDLAAHLSLMKLGEIFPDIPRETLSDILTSNGNCFNDTVEMLHSNIDQGGDEENHDIPSARAEQLVRTREQKNGRGENSTSHSNDDNGKGERNSKASSIQPDEAKRLALHDFQEMRNLAVHHCQLKAECYQKAKEAIQKGNSDVALHYSQIANMHKQKIDMFNHRAASCIVHINKYTHNDPDLLDLHHLSVVEADYCLDLFLDRHITRLRTTTRTYKNVFIITGRGLHSIGGISAIKTKVKSRLKDRNLRWNEVNPGLLKVKIFSLSKHSDDI